MLTHDDGLERSVLHRVRNHLEAHLGDRITLDDMATLAGMSRFHFARQFRISTGLSPMEYLRRARVERSKRMLRESDLTIASIAVRLGFADQSHFTRTFGRMVGISPSNFARRVENTWDPTGDPRRAS